MRERVEYPSAMQSAFVRAALAATPEKTSVAVVRRVARVADRVRLHSEPSVNTKLSFRTAKKLISEGVIE